MVAPDPRRGRPDKGRPEHPSQDRRRFTDHNGQILDAATVEREIMRISADLDDGTHDLARLAEQAANAEATYKVKYHKAWATRKIQDGNGPGGRCTDGEAEAHAIGQCEAELRARLLTDAIYDSAKESLRTKRAQLDALRTIAANIRAQT